MSDIGTTSFGINHAMQAAQNFGVDPYRPTPYLDDKAFAGNWTKGPAQTQWSAPTYNNFNYQKYESNSGDPSYKQFNQAAPQYKGLTGGDYDRYELNLRQPGEQAAQRAYASAKQDLTDAYSSRGMYGSSQFTRQMDNQANRSYLDAVTQNAANATTQRYGMQSQEQQYINQQEMAAWQAHMAENQQANQQNYNVWQNRMAENQQMNNMLFQDNAANNEWNWRSSTSVRDWIDSQAQRQIDYGNSVEQARQNWFANGMQWNAAQNDSAWNRTYNIWQGYDPEVEAWNKNILKRQSDMATQQASGGGSGIGGLISSIGGMAGGLVSMIPGAGQIAGPLISMGSKLAGGIVDQANRR